MYETAGYCNAMVVTTTYHTFSSTEDFAVSTYENYFGKNSSGIVFVIDRDLNEIYLASEGDARKNITDSKCDVICDNTYVYAGHVKIVSIQVSAAAADRVNLRTIITSCV